MSCGQGTPSGAQQVLAEIPGQTASGEQSTIALAQALVVEQSASIGPLLAFLLLIQNSRQGWTSVYGRGKRDNSGYKCSSLFPLMYIMYAIISGWSSMGGLSQCLVLNSSLLEPFCQLDNTENYLILKNTGELQSKEPWSEFFYEAKSLFTKQKDFSALHV